MPSCLRASPRFIIANRVAFQILLQKFRPRSNFGDVFFPVLLSFDTGMRTSCVCVVMWQSVNRIASAPWDSMMSSGSTPLPRLLDILRPCSSSTKPWVSTPR